MNTRDYHAPSSIKRVAWALGCAKKDSEEESELYAILLEKIEAARSRRFGTVRPQALIAKLEHELMVLDEPLSISEWATRHGWNMRARSLVRFLQGTRTNQCGEVEDFARVVVDAQEADAPSEGG